METRFITPLFCYDDEEEKSGFFSIPLRENIRNYIYYKPCFVNQVFILFVRFGLNKFMT